LIASVALNASRGGALAAIGAGCGGTAIARSTPIIRPKAMLVGKHMRRRAVRYLRELNTAPEEAVLRWRYGDYGWLFKQLKSASYDRGIEYNNHSKNGSKLGRSLLSWRPL
jgi:hypothetical protein